MKKTTIIIFIILIVILGFFIYFYFKKSTPSLSPEFQLLQPPQPIETPLFETPTSTLIETPTQTITKEPITETQLETQNIVVYTDSGYSPNTLRVKVGTNITFKNQSSRAMWPASDLHPTHRLYSGTSLTEHCPDTAGTAFDACTGIQPGNSWSFTFNKKGTWKYHDHLNPSSIGTIIVE